MMPGLHRAFLHDLRQDTRGGVLVEFALLAPVLLTMIMGVIQVGIHVQNSNAVQNLAADGARLAAVEYQKGNAITDAQIEALIEALGTGPKYVLEDDRLKVNVDTEVSRIAGVLEKTIEIKYTAPDYLAFVDTELLVLEYERPVFLLP